MACGPEKPRNMESARKAAVKLLRDIFYDQGIDINLFKGPIFEGETEKGYMFRWYSTVPRPGATVLEINVPRDPNTFFGMGLAGPRPSIRYLVHSSQLPISQAVLRSVFHLPPPFNLNERIKRLSLVPLDTAHLEDIANFVEISWELSDYARCFGRHLPTNLEEIKNVAGSQCNVDKIDSLYMHDRYGREYIYENLIDFAMLGSPGQNLIWDFDKAVLESVYYDQLEHIYVSGDDILVKFKPLH